MLGADATLLIQMQMVHKQMTLFAITYVTAWIISGLCATFFFFFVPKSNKTSICVRYRSHICLEESFNLKC